MSWDLFIFNSDEKIEAVETIASETLKLTDFCKIFKQHFKKVKKRNNHIEIAHKNFYITYIYDDHPVNHKMVSVDGENGFLEFVKLAKQYNWQIFDTELGEMIDLENPARNGYKNFKNFLQRILSIE